MKYLHDYILACLSRGKFFFTKHEALTKLACTPSQFRYQAYRLAKKKAIKKLHGDFFMIVSPEYYSLGSLPLHWVVDPLMKYLGQDYYIGLLSAASLYCSTEQQPTIFQVITNKQTKPIVLERGVIEFHVYKYCEQSFKTQLTVPTGYVNIATKEQTLVDLIRFYAASGYLSNVALVIHSLAEECDPLLLARVLGSRKSYRHFTKIGLCIRIC